MKKFCIGIFILLILLVTVIVGMNTPQEQEYLRIHVRAHSNSTQDQQIKYEVKDSIVAYLTPKLKGVEHLQDAKAVVMGELTQLTTLADQLLQQRGFAYGSRAKLVTEQFPTRVYGTLTLPEGEYQALIIELGSGEGDNWWCVVYPPLCFTGGENVQYRWLLQKLFERD